MWGNLNARGDLFFEFLDTLLLIFSPNFSPFPNLLTWVKRLNACNWSSFISWTFSFVNWAHSRCCKFDFFCHSWLAKQSAYLAGHWIMLSPDMKKLVSNLPKTSNNGFTFSWELQWIWIFVGSHLLVDPQAFWRTKTWLERTTIWTWLVCVFEKTYVCEWTTNAVNVYIL